MHKHHRLLAILTAAALAAGCGEKDKTCHTRELAHVDPLPPAEDAFALRYTEVGAKDGIAYVGTADHGVLVIDPDSGQEIGRVEDGSYIAGLAVGGNWLVAAADNAIAVYDISNPRQPARGRRYTSPTFVSCHTVFVHGDIAYCSTARSAPPHVVMVRLSLPASGPVDVTEVGTYTLPEWQNPASAPEGWVVVHDLFVHERGGRTLAYLAYWERGLQIIDVTDPAQPQWMGGEIHQVWTHSVWVEGDYAYVGLENYKGGVQVYDVSDVTSPRLLGELQSKRGEASSAHNVQVHDGRVYASWYQDGLRIFEAAGVSKPDEIGAFNTWNEADNRKNPADFGAIYSGAWDVFVDPEGRAYIADIQTGLWVTEYDASESCGGVYKSGTSAYARDGRPPIGFGPHRPLAARVNRTIHVQVPVESADYYFTMTDAVLNESRPKLDLSGATAIGDTRTDYYATSPGAGWAVRLFQLPASASAGALNLTGRLEDRGEERSFSRAINLLPEAPPNTDTEPNNEYGTSIFLSGAATVSGNVGGSDRYDLFRIDQPAGAAARAIQVRVEQLSAGSPAPATSVFLNRSGSTSGTGIQMTATGASPLAFTGTVQVPAGEGTWFLVLSTRDFSRSRSYELTF